MKTAKIQVSTQIDGDKLEQTVELTGGKVILLDEPIPKGSSSLAVDLAFATAKLKSIHLQAIDSDLTLLCTYTGEHGTKSITLEVGTDFFWADGLGPANPFAYDVASLAVTEGNVAAATLVGKLLVDPT